MSVKATVENMKEYAHLEPVAWSPYTLEQYSANPGDYWDIALDECMVDSEGEEMVLTREITVTVGIDRYEDAIKFLNEHLR